MKKRYYWNDEFTDRSFDKFIKFQNDLTEDEKFELWVNSNGGECIVGEMVRDIIESYDSDKFTLVGADRLYSCALDLFVTAKCKKRLIPGTTGLVHTTYSWVKINDMKEFRLKYSEDKLLINGCSMVKEMDELIPKVLTEEELDKYYHNQDVYLTTEDIKKFLT